MATDFEARRVRRRDKVERLERRLRKLQRQRGRREFRRAWRPVRYVALLALIAVGAWFFVPRFFDPTVTADAADGARQAALQEVEDLQESILEDVSDAIGIEVGPIDDVMDLDGAIDGWSTPLDRIDADRATRPHHTYAAWDYGTRVGTSAYAMSDGTVLRATDDDGGRCGGMVAIRTTHERAVITYCHLSEVFVATDDRVRAGDLIGLTGGKPGAAGAGRSSGPHLHLQIQLDGELRCPQAQLVALNAGQPLSVRDLPTTGCWYSAAPFTNATGVDAFAGPGDLEPDPDDPLAIFDP